MIRVQVESPYKGNAAEIALYEEYARAALQDAIHRGEAPFASHLLYTQPGVLRDGIPGERDLGIEAGLVWGLQAEKTVVYEDFGVTEGMRKGIDRAHEQGRPVEFRQIEGWPRECGGAPTANALLDAIRHAFGDRSGECLREAMHSPIFVILRRQVIATREPWGWEFDGDGDLVMSEDHADYDQEDEDDPTFKSGRELEGFLLDSECAVETWFPDRAFGTRKEAEDYQNVRGYNYPSGSKVYSINMEGVLRSAVRALFA